MGTLFRILIRLGAVGLLALAGYALFAELPAPRQPVSVVISSPDGGDD